MSISNSLNQLFDDHKAIILIIATCFSGVAGWGLNSEYGTPSIQKVNEVIERNPSLFEKSPYETLLNGVPVLTKVEIRDKTVVCQFDPYLGYELSLLLEIEYIRWLIEIGTFGHIKEDLKARINELSRIRNYCIDNDTMSDEEKKEMFDRQMELYMGRYKSSSNTEKSNAANN